MALKKKKEKVRIADTRPFRKEKRTDKPKRYQRKTEHRKGGRPRTEINWVIVKRMARIHCTPQEIASVLDIPWQTLVHQPEFRTVYTTGWHKGNSSLRRKQFRLAMQGDGRMLIWLGKQNLGQKDRSEQIVTTAEGMPLLGGGDSNQLDVNRLGKEDLLKLREIYDKLKRPQLVEAQAS